MIKSTQKLSELFRKSIEEGYKNYLISHPRSPLKILPMHQCISEILLEKLKDKANHFAVKSMGIGDGKEHKFKGAYYEKDVDITIFYKEKPIAGLGFKFITSNYKQNSNNYFENMLGETANLKRADFVYGHMIILKQKMPYYSNDKKTFTKIEKINDSNILKYLKLHKDTISNLHHKPDFLFLNFVKTGDEKAFENIVKTYEKGEHKMIQKTKFHKNLLQNVKINFIKNEAIQKEFSKEIADYITKVNDFEKFIKAFIFSLKTKTYGK